MISTIRSKVVKIGNSRGIRIPQALLKQAGLTDEVDLKVVGNRLIIQASHQPRQGWDASFQSMAEKDDDRPLDELTSTQWDEEEWTW